MYDDLTDWLGQYKDQLSIIFSFLAFVIATAGYLQKSSEKRLGVRKQLTDAIAKLLDLNVEGTKANDERTKDNYPANYGVLISDQRRLMTRQAMYLAEKIPRETSPYELMVLAVAFDDIDDTVQAEALFLLAIKRTVGEFDRVIVRRQYARFLFRIDRFGDGRHVYDEAAALVTGTTDRHFVYLGDTFERRARAEKDYGDWTKINDLLDEAEKHFRKIRVSGTRQRLLNRTQALRTEVDSAKAQHLEQKLADKVI